MFYNSKDPQLPGGTVTPSSSRTLTLLWGLTLLPISGTEKCEFMPFLNTGIGHGWKWTQVCGVLRKQVIYNPLPITFLSNGKSFCKIWPYPGKPPLAPNSPALMILHEDRSHVKQHTIITWTRLLSLKISINFLVSRNVSLHKPSKHQQGNELGARTSGPSLGATQVTPLPIPPVILAFSTGPCTIGSPYLLTEERPNERWWDK